MLILYPIPQKAAARRAVAHLVPGAEDPEFEWALQPGYQSTDVSEIEEVGTAANVPPGALDPNTDDEQPPQPEPKTTRTVWVSHKPAWRIDPVSNPHTISAIESHS